jgi:hypothetical protein
MPCLRGVKTLRLLDRRVGHTGLVRASEIVAPVRLGAAIRNRRLFHPVGVVAEGIFQRVAPPNGGLPVVSCDVIGRVSKGIGLRGARPDIAGLAWRMPPQQDLRSCTPWDILLASTVDSSIDRLVLRPAFSWSGTTFSSVMPLRYQGGVWWVRARLATVIDTPGLSLAAVADQISSSGIDFDIEQAAGTGDFLLLARLTLRNVDPTCDDIAFDPALHSDPKVKLVPGWLGDFRRAAYRRSREGRDAQ